MGQASIEAGVEQAAAWPAFRRDLAQAQHLVRYVNPAHVGTLGLSDGSAYAQRAIRGTVEGNRTTVQRTYEAIRQRRYPYSDDPFLLDAELQHVRHPRELDGLAGTCLDFAIFGASQLLSDRIAPILLVGTLPGGGAHAWVAADLARDPNDLVDPTAGGLARAPGADGVPELLDQRRRALLADHRWLVLDITAAALRLSGPSSFAEAVAAGAQHLVDAVDVVAADVTSSQAQPGMFPYPGDDPAREAPIRRLLPAVPHLEDYGPSRRSAAALVQGSAGRLVITGEPGRGKSVLALSIAASAAGGRGWFLGAGSIEALRFSLAEAELLHRHGAAGEISNDLVAEQAKAAKERLERSAMPWVVVLDNANQVEAADQQALLALAPVPDPTVGQLLIVTSTATGWASCEPVPLGPVPDAVLGLDPALRAKGRPLFGSAYRRLQATLGSPLAARPEILDARPEADAGELLWAMASGELRRRGLHAGSAAIVAAWLPPDRIELAPLAAAVGAEPAGLLAALVAFGLVEASGAGVCKMHRLVGAAIRAAPPGEGDLERLAIVLRSHGVDPDTYSRLCDDLVPQLLGSAPPSSAGLQAIHAVAAAGEHLGRVPDAASLMAKILPYLHGAPRADAIHLIERDRFQNKKAALGPADLELLDEAIRLREAEPAGDGERGEVLRVLGAEKVKALRALVAIETSLRALSALPVGADRARLRQEILGHVAVLEESVAIRAEILGATDSHVVRAEFNLGMGLFNLARTEPDLRKRHELQTRSCAQYGRTAAARQAMVPPAPRPHLAASFAGKALSGLFASLTALRLASAEGLEAWRDATLTASKELRGAGRDLEESLRLREASEEVDGSDVAKSVRLGIKVGLARLLLIGGRDLPLDSWGQIEDLGKLAAELEDELGWLGWPPA